MRKSGILIMLLMLVWVAQADITGTIVSPRDITVRTSDGSSDWYHYGYPPPPEDWRDRYDWAGNAPGLPDCFMAQSGYGPQVRTTIPASELIEGEEYAVYILYSIKLNSAGEVVKDGSIMAGFDDPNTLMRLNESNSTNTGMVSRYENDSNIFTVFEGHVGNIVADPTISLLIEYAPNADRTIYHGLAYSRACAVLPVPGDIQAYVDPNLPLCDVTPGTISLSWTPADSNTVSQELYYFVDDIENFRDNCSYNAVTPVVLSNTASTYDITAGYDQYVIWRVDTVTDDSTLDGTGETWVFMTKTTYPQIITEPADDLVGAGSDAVFTVEAFNPQNGSSIVGLSFKWYKAGSPDQQLSDGTEYAGTTTDTLKILAVDLDDEGEYFCRVTLDSNGETIDSQTTSLTVGWLVAHYAFDENANDSSIQANDGIWPDPVLEAYNTTSPVIGSGAVIFMGNDPNTGNPNSYINIGADAAPNPQTQAGIKAGEGSISCWFKTSSSATMAICGTLNDGDSTAFQLNLNDGAQGRLRVYVQGQEYGTTDLSADADPNSVLNEQWHHVAFTWSELAFEGVVYLDGLSIFTSETLLSVMAEWQYPMLIGARNNRGIVDQYFVGELDELKIYNYPLTPQDVAYQYLAGPAESLCQPPEYDLDGDCIVDLADFALIADDWLIGKDLSDLTAFVSAWLECGWYPQGLCP